MIIVIDGPAGSGKSSTARAIAEQTGIQFLDSGAFYRAITLIYIDVNCDRAAFFDALKTYDVTFQFKNEIFHVFLNGNEVTELLREQRISEMVSEVATINEAREFVNTHLREVVKSGDFIADGRDLGTAVFPDADYKFYFVADIRERARRRFKEMTQAGLDADLNQIIANINERDHKDSSREIAPLRKADDAIEVDTGKMTLEEQVQFVIDQVRY